MALTLIVEDGTGVDNANSYGTVEELDAYYEGHAYAPTFAGEEQKKQLLVQAAREMDSSFTLRGAPKTWDQDRAFPRVGMVIDIDPAVSSNASVLTGGENVLLSVAGAIPDNVVPKRWKQAVFEYVRFLAAKDRATKFDAPALKREKIDAIEREFSSGGSAIDLIPEIVQRMASPFVAVAKDAGAGPGAGGTAQAVRLVRG